MSLTDIGHFQKFARRLLSHDFVNPDGAKLHERLVALGIEAKAIARNAYDQMIVLYEWPHSEAKVQFQVFYFRETSDVWFNLSQGYNNSVKYVHVLIQSIITAIEDGD